MTLTADSLTGCDLGLEERITRRTATVGVIGLGNVGFTAVRLSIAGGYRAVGVDIDPDVVADRQAALAHSGLFRAGTKTSLLVDADILIIAIRLIPASRTGDFRSPFYELLSALRALPNRPRLFILETTVPPGTTREFAQQLCHARNDSLLAYCPERLGVGDELDVVTKVPRLVGGVTSAATNAACMYLEHIRVPTVTVSSPEVAELSKLLENAFITTGISLVGEITRVAHELGINANEVAEAAATKPDGYFPFRPGAGIGGNCLLNDLQFLRLTASDLRVEVPLLEGVERASGRISHSVISRLDSLMKSRGLSLFGATVWIVGVGFKIGSSDTTNTPAIELVRLLLEYEAAPIYSDADVLEFEYKGRAVPRVAIEEWPAQVDAVVILSGDRTRRLDVLQARVPLVLDIGGGRIMDGSSAGIETL